MNNYKETAALVSEEERSYFDGGYFAYIGYNILAVLVTAITFGIAFPWMCCMLQRWKSKHTVVCGKRMYFDGTGVQLIGKYLLWSLLTIITFGIYGFWMSLSVKKWITKHTHFVGEEDNNSYFDGGVGGLIGTNILSALVIAVPVVGFAWSALIKLRWEIKHTVVDSRRLVFIGTVGSLFVKYLLWGFLTVITFGIFGLFVPVKSMRWEAERTIDNEHTTEALIKRSEYRSMVHTDAAAFKTFAVENEMECVRAGITDTMSEEELLTLANKGVRCAQYEYVIRYSEGNYTQEPYSAMLRSAASASYPPAMCLYAETHTLDEGLRRELFTRAADKGQIRAVRACMQFTASDALALPENKSALPALKQAVRYGDLLTDSGNGLDDSELFLVKKCTFEIRRIESSVYTASKGGLIAAIIVAVVIGVPLLLALVMGGIYALKEVSNSYSSGMGYGPGIFADRYGANNLEENYAGVVAGDGFYYTDEESDEDYTGSNDVVAGTDDSVVQDDSYSDEVQNDAYGDTVVQENVGTTAMEDSFWSVFNGYMVDEFFYNVSEISSEAYGESGTATTYQLTCSHWYWSSEFYMTVSAGANGIESVGLYGFRVIDETSPDPTINQMEILDCVKVIYEALGIGGYFDITPYDGTEPYSEYHGDWLITYQNTDSEIIVTITK